MKKVIKRLEKGYRNYNPKKNWERLRDEPSPYAVTLTKHRKKKVHKRKCK